MRLFASKSEMVDAKAKDAVLRLLYAYNKSVVPVADQNLKAAPFRNHETYTPTDKEVDIENSIRNVKNDADFNYANSIIKFLFVNDYIGKAKTALNVTYYGLTRTGALYFESNGFEKSLREEQRTGSENFYKWVTLFVAFAAIVTPIFYNMYFDNRNELVEPLNTIKISIDSLNKNIKQMQSQPMEIIQKIDSIK